MANRLQNTILIIADEIDRTGLGPVICGAGGGPVVLAAVVGDLLVHHEIGVVGGVYALEPGVCSERNGCISVLVIGFGLGDGSAVTGDLEGNLEVGTACLGLGAGGQCNGGHGCKKQVLLHINIHFWGPGAGSAAPGQYISAL